MTPPGRAGPAFDIALCPAGGNPPPSIRLRTAPAGAALGWSMAGPSIIVVGASAGGIDALKQVVRGLPADLPAAVCVVLHVPAHGPSILPRILSRAGPLPAAHPDDHEALRPAASTSPRRTTTCWSSRGTSG